MAMENIVGIQTRAMIEAQSIEDGTHGNLVNNPERVQDAKYETRNSKSKHEPYSESAQK